MIKVDTIDLIIEEFSDREKSKSNNVEVQIPLEIPYWPETTPEIESDKKDTNKKEKNNNIYEGDDVITFDMNSLYD